MARNMRKRSASATSTTNVAPIAMLSVEAEVYIGVSEYICGALFY